MHFELVECADGDVWFPWNYRRRTKTGRVGVTRFAAEPGLVVFNAVDGRGRVLGSCSMRIGYRHSQDILRDEEYQYGAMAAGPAYFWADDDACPWILVVKSFWVRPGVRRNGIARAFASRARDIGLPAYLGFANKHLEAWFNREFRPGAEPSRLQTRIETAMRAPAAGFEPERKPDFTVFLQAEASAMLLWQSWHGAMDESVGLAEALCDPDRAGAWDVDSGEVFEAGFSDSAFAADRAFGYRCRPGATAGDLTEGPSTISLSMRRIGLRRRQRRVRHADVVCRGIA